MDQKYVFEIVFIQESSAASENKHENNTISKFSLIGANSEIAEKGELFYIVCVSYRIEKRQFV